MSALRARGLSLHLGTRCVLEAIDFDLQPGEMVLVAGRNGAGKSTLLRALIAALPSGAGVVELGGRPLSLWEPRARAREVAFVAQDPETSFDFSGRELVAMGRHPHRGRRDAFLAEDHAAITRALTAVDALPFADRPVTTLSGGELRRIAVARALATEAPLLLLDEPTSNLDLEHALQLMQLLRRLADEGRGVLVASHDLNLVAPRCHRVVLLHERRILVDAPPQAALNAANVAAVFGVRAAPSTGWFPRDFHL